jgi:hypothetical protein
MTFQNRRSFLTAFASLAGAATLRGSAAQEQEANRFAPPAKGDWDLTWFDNFKGKHKQVYDLGYFQLTPDPRPFHFVTNFLDAFHDIYKLDDSALNTAVGISGPAFALNASDKLWEKYALGERYKITDPATGKPAVRNIFLDGGPRSIKAMQARGTIFWQCNVALGGVASQLAAANHTNAADVRAELVAGLNPGVRIVPSHVMALALAHERGFSYVRA